jgi:glutamate-1-semialdehyde aminotransferase
MLLSKNKNLFSPGLWPCYYSKAKGAVVWDIDDNQYYDFATNGVGACSLGHAYTPVDEAVRQAISNGVMSTLNAPVEVELAELLLKLNPWAGMVRFARSGGEANAISIRIARAYSKKEKIVICGYHGWHDWYLAANLESQDNLNGHLLEGLSPIGVPASLAGTVIPIRFNNFEDLAKLEKIDDIAAIKLEVARSTKSSQEYLKAVRELCDKKDIILIFDECTSGFRETYGGVFSQYNLNPDMVMFGKALGNGYAITAVVGTSEVMASASETFISSTFWTESIGPTAACATLMEMAKQKSWKILPQTGASVKNIWLAASSQFDIPIKVEGLDALPTFTFLTPSPLAYKTLFTEQMLQLGFLASTAFYATTAHTIEIVNAYEQAVFEAFEFLGKIYTSNLSPDNYLKGSCCYPTFKRLN